MDRDSSYDEGYSSYRPPESPEVKSWRLTAEEMSAERPGLLVIEIEYSKEKRDHIGKAGERYLWAEASDTSLRSALEREQVLESADNARKRGDRLKAFFNGQEVTKQLYEVVDCGKPPRAFPPVMTWKDTKKRKSRVEGRQSRYSRSSLLDSWY